VTRLGEGVDAGGRLGDEPQRRVFEVLGQYAEAIRAHGTQRAVAVMTSAVRDAANGAEFARAVGERFGLDGRTLSGDEEARLTYLGATAARADPEPLLVIDIGGGSTELVIGVRGEVRFHVSTQIGVVRHSERHLSGDPPDPRELGALAGAVEKELEATVPAS
jgi:exopolyphosphatase / guanosine-5'-triphosphate,3'-diphosphate pyrophosphatase